MRRLATTLASTLCFTHAFQPLRSLYSRPSTSVYATKDNNDDAFESVIRAEEDDFDVDEGKGGVRLAIENIIQLNGSVQHKPGSAQPQLEDLQRYRNVTPLPVNKVEEHGVSIICTGTGIEFYGDPGDTYEAETVYGPMDAVKRAVNTAASVATAERLVVTFCGGADAQVLEVLEAVEKMVLLLDAPTATPIQFRSISHDVFPEAQSSVCMVALPKTVESTEGMDAMTKAVLDGQVYWSEGNYYTLLPSDINNATE